MNQFIFMVFIMSFGSFDGKNEATLSRENSYTICNLMDFFSCAGSFYYVTTMAKF